ncbi:hypothetical protein L198_00721 [Cryptococcus wingfieldii CBS 7118]|uniref:Mitochondrial carrier protein n=1 Tax=Cryptococcus wingfieldii CBS 7118 TaxID=1295528 RepID=A0A1E3K4H7_9TREE|nr:hypothetical protein L198_00721 [Cryptococcus wingfieldii CBS 7118]ODO07142.1 hypothetical protein L198_00721 [Cryptococcus wingfieldii CBS 7118]
MFEFILTLLLAAVLMAAIMAASVAITMPFSGALVRLRANYNPHAVGLGQEARVGPTLHTLLGTLKRTKELEGWWGIWKGTFPTLVYSTLISILSIAFVGGSATKGPKNTYSVPEAGGVSMAIFTIILTLIALPMTVIINRSIITPYKLPNSPAASLRILLTPVEISKPYLLYLTPGLLATTFAHALCATLIARTMRVFFLGTAVITEETTSDIAWWRWLLYFVWQCLATLWFTPLEVIATRLSVQPNTGGAMPVEGAEDEPLEGVSFCGTDEDVIGLRPATEPYNGLLDCARKIVEEEGWPSLYRGFWFTMMGNVFGSTMA